LGDGADAAIVELGANDGLRGVDPKETEKNLTAILDKLAAKHIPVLLTGMYAMQPGRRLCRGLPRRV
jgi:acyl-CoA thioesterase-1